LDNEYVSTELFHFVGQKTPLAHDANWKVLSSILKSGCISYPPHDVGWGETRYEVDFGARLDEGELIVPEMTCFCDIPVRSLGIHCEKYGCFGISLNRELLVKYGARPVTYFPMLPDDPGSIIYGKAMLADFQSVYHALRNYVTFAPEFAGISKERVLGETKATAEAVSAIGSVFAKDVLAFLKPFDATLAPDDRRNYYMEREWRRLGNMCFESSHVQHVLVARGYATRAKREFPMHRGKISEIDFQSS
jgi:hypothetical protein